MLTTVIFCNAKPKDISLQDKLALADQIKKRHNALYADLVYTIVDKKMKQVEFGFDVR